MMDPAANPTTPTLPVTLPDASGLRSRLWQRRAIDETTGMATLWAQNSEVPAALKYLARAPESLCCLTAVRISMSTRRICASSQGIPRQQLAQCEAQRHQATWKRQRQRQIIRRKMDHLLLQVDDEGFQPNQGCLCSTLHSSDAVQTGSASRELRICCMPVPARVRSAHSCLMGHARDPPRSVSVAS